MNARRATAGVHCSAFPQSQGRELGFCMPPGLQPCHFDPYVTYILGGFAFSLLIGLVWFRVWFRVWEAHRAVGKLEIIEKAFQAPQTQL